MGIFSNMGKRMPVWEKRGYAKRYADLPKLRDLRARACAEERYPEYQRLHDQHIRNGMTNQELRKTINDTMFGGELKAPALTDEQIARVPKRFLPRAGKPQGKKGFTTKELRKRGTEGDFFWVYDNFGKPEAERTDPPSAAAMGLMAACQDPKSGPVIYKDVLNRIAPKSFVNADTNMAEDGRDLSGLDVLILEEWQNGWAELKRSFGAKTVRRKSDLETVPVDENGKQGAGAPGHNGGVRPESPVLPEQFHVGLRSPPETVPTDHNVAGPGGLHQSADPQSSGEPPAGEPVPEVRCGGAQGPGPGSNGSESGVPGLAVPVSSGS